jgi:hypothetical protein
MPETKPAAFCFPTRSGWEWALYVYVILCALRPWIVGAALFPRDPAAVRVIYRSPMGDIQYFPMINALAGGNFGENAVYESWGKGVESFPFASLIFHAGATAIFGSYAGYLLADVVVTLAFFFLFRTWCRLFSAREGWADFIAALFACGLPDIYVNLGQIWGQRLPRPFVSDLYFIAGLTLLVWLAWKPERLRARPPWLALGAILALCAQSFIYEVPVLVLAAGYVVVLFLAFPGGATLKAEDRTGPALATSELRMALSRAGWAVAVFVILLTPFWLQRMFESPDAPGRLGIFPVDRWSIWSNPVWRDTGGAFSGGLFCLMMLALFNLFSRQLKLAPLPGRVLILLALLQVGALIAMPLQATLTGTLIQPFHYLIVSRSVQTCLLVAWLSYVGGGLLPRFSAAPLVAGALLLASFYVVTQREIVADQSLGPLRPDIYTPPGPAYHAAFENLARELDRDLYKDDRVLATTDHQVYVYWVGFHHGFAFLPDNFSTTLSNQEIEDRLLWFARAEDLDPASLGRFLDQKAILVFWLGTDLYQCSPLYHRAPLSDYAPEDVARNFAHPPDLGSFALTLPKTDLQRLQDRYAQILASPLQDQPRLDLIILATDQRHFPLPAPDASRYTLTYHDDYFRVWQAIRHGP